MIRGIHHVAINTPNLDRMVEFYRDVIGFSEIYTGGWRENPHIDSLIGVPNSAARQVMLWSGSAYLELFEYSQPAAADRPPLRPNDHGYTHLCLDVEDIDAEYDRLTAAGAKFQRRPPESTRARAVYGADPDGNVIEIQEILQHDHAMYLPPR